MVNLEKLTKIVAITFIISFILVFVMAFKKDAIEIREESFKNQVNMSIKDYALEEDLGIWLMKDESENWNFAKNPTELNNAVEVKSVKLMEVLEPSKYPEGEIVIVPNESYTTYTLDELESEKNSKSHYLQEYYSFYLTLALIVSFAISFIMFFALYYISTIRIRLKEKEPK